MRRSYPRRSWRINGTEYKSRYEYDIAVDLISRGVEFEYEAKAFNYTVQVTHGYCPECGTKPAVVDRSYTPDFFLSNGVIVEAKGRFTSAERKKHAAIREQYPDLKLYLLFAQNNLLQKGGKKKYTEWCDSKKICSAVGKKVPEEWIEEGL